MLPRNVTDLLGRQYNLISHAQLRDAVPDPLERAEVRRRLELHPLTTRVLGQQVHPDGLGRGVTLRVLDAGPGSLLWSKSGASWWGFGRHRISPVHVGRLRCGSGSRPPADAQLHQLRAIDPLDVTEHRGVAIGRPELTTLWIAGMLTHRFPNHPEIALEKLERVLEHAWTQKLIDGPYLHSLVERSGGKGRSGIVLMRDALEKRPPDYVPHGSGTELRFSQIIPGSIADRLSRQVSVRDEQLIGVVDFELQTWPLIVEVNGEFWHTSWPDRQRDRHRYERLLARGYSVLVWWDYDVWQDPSLVIQETARIVNNPDSTPMLHRPSKAPWEL